MTRCFLAFELSEDSRAYLAERARALHARLAGELGWPVRLVPPDNWHATLLFFDDLDPAQREAAWGPVAEGARAGAWRGLAFAWRGFALWPSPRRPSLVCLEGDEYPGTAGWPVAPLLAQEPFCRGDVAHFRRYRPHVTVMRLRRGRHRLWARDWEGLSGALPAIEPGRVRFDRVSFFLSTLSRDAPIYPRERTAPLG